MSTPAAFSFAGGFLPTAHDGGALVTILPPVGARCEHRPALGAGPRPTPVEQGGAQAFVQWQHCQRQFEIARKCRRNFVVFRRGGVTKLSVSLLKKSVHDLLFLAHKFLALLQAVRLALDVNDSAVMQYTIQDGGGDGDAGKDLVPLGESLVGGKNGGRFLIPSGNELEEQVCTLDVHGEVADFVNDEHPVLGQNLELIRQTVLKVGLLELFNELVAVDVVGGEPVLCCYQAQGGGQTQC